MASKLNYESPDETSSVPWKLGCAGLSLSVVLVAIFIVIPPATGGLQICFAVMWLLAVALIGISGVSHLRTDASKGRVLVICLGVLEIMVSAGLVIGYVPIHNEFQVLRLNAAKP